MLESKDYERLELLACSQAREIWRDQVSHEMIAMTVGESIVFVAMGDGEAYAIFRINPNGDAVTLISTAKAQPMDMSRTEDD